jgi:geranylgeranyl diphosphate synthase type I
VTDREARGESPAADLGTAPSATDAGSGHAEPAESEVPDGAAGARSTTAFPGPIGAAVEQALESFIGSRADELMAISQDLGPVVDAARAAVHGGKRLRAAFVYWGWRAAGGAPLPSGAESGPGRGIRPGSRRDTGDPPVVAAAAAVELVHASALTHDDVMDDSATRRGGPSAHRRFAELPEGPELPDGFEPSAASARFGRNGAILLGDLLLLWSDQMLGGAGFKPKRLAAARPYFDRLRSEVAAGQYLDVLTQTSRTVSASRAMLVVRYKSAKYTIERPLQFGAALANGPSKLLAALSSYGVPLGEAFQLRDDILGVFGDTARTGKPAGDDIREGKRTLLVARAYDHADAAQRKVLDATIGNPELTPEALDATRGLLRETGALAAVETVIAELTTAALVAVATAPVDAESRAALEALAHRTTTRDL